MANWKLLHSDCIKAMRAMPDCSVDSIVCDPPYELGFMGKKWDSTGIAFDVAMWAECLRVLKPGGHLVAFGGQRTIHRITSAIEDAGFDVRDLGAWQYWSGFPKSLDVSKAIDAAAGAEREVVGYGDVGRASNVSPMSMGAHGANDTRAITAPATADAKTWQGWGTALKPCLEPWVLCRKPFKGTVAANVLRWGTGGLNIDGCRYAYGDRAWPGPNESLDVGPQNATLGAWENEKYRCGSCAKAAAKTPKQSTRETGASTAQSPVAPTTKGRAGTRREGTSKTATGSLFGPSPAAPSASKTGASSLNTAEYGKTPTGQSQRGTSSTTRTATNSTTGSQTCTSCGAATTPDSMQSSAGRFPANVYVCPKPSTAEREIGCGHLARATAGELTDRAEGSDGLQSPRAGAGRTSNGRGNTHPTVKPIALMQWLCRLVTPPGGLVLDPFAGSGTTGIAAVREGFGFVGCEMDPAHVVIARARIIGDAPLLNSMNQARGQ